MLARIDGTTQFSEKDVEEVLRESVSVLSSKIAKV
jgi:hypothetical protein